MVLQASTERHAIQLRVGSYLSLIVVDASLVRHACEALTELNIDNLCQAMASTLISVSTLPEIQEILRNFLFVKEIFGKWNISRKFKNMESNM